MKKISVLLILFVLALYGPTALGKNNAKQIIEQDQFLAFVSQKDTIIIDVRTAWEYENGFIPGALNFPHKKIIKGELSLENFKDKKILLYCHTGVRVNTVRRYLANNTNIKPENIFNLKGDYRAWQARGYKVESLPSK